MPLGMEVGVGPGDIVLDGHPAAPIEMGTAAKRLPISATAGLLYANGRPVISNED